MSDDPTADLRNALLRAAVRRHRPWWRRRPIVLAPLAVVLIAAPATAAIGGLWSPDVPPAAPMTTTIATSAATPAAPCPPSSSRDATGTPPANVRNVLAVLRTPQTAADRAGQAFAKRDDRIRVATAFIRLLGTDASGERQWIAPAQQNSATPSGTGDCSTSTERSWTLMTFSARGGGGAGDAATLMRRGAIGSSGASDRESTVTGIAPDGVAEVSVSYDGSAPRTWPVRRNFFSYRVALPADRAAAPDVAWKNAAGDVIGTVKAP